MIDNLLAVGSCFDWISPLYAMARDAAHGGGHTFLLDGGGWSALEIEQLLRDHGATTWGLTLDGDSIMVSCPKEQAAWATAILESGGIVIESGAVPTDKAAARGPAQPTGRQPRRLRGRSRLWRLIEGGVRE